MEQLTLTQNDNPEIFHRGRSMELAMLSKKVTIKLSIEQLRSLVYLLTNHLYRHPLITLREKATMYNLVKLESKLRPKMYLPLKSFKLSIDVAQAFALVDMIDTAHIGLHPYEAMTCNYITGEIDHQTV